MTRTKLFQKVAFVTSCLAIGTSASVYVVNRNAIHREDRNTCAIKDFLSYTAQRTAAVNNPGATKAVAILTNLNTQLKPNTECVVKIDWSIIK